MTVQEDKMKEITICILVASSLHFGLIPLYLAVSFPGSNECLLKNENNAGFVKYTHNWVILGSIFTVLSLLNSLKKILAQKIFNSVSCCCIIGTALVISIRMCSIIKTCYMHNGEYKHIFDKEIVIVFVFMATMTAISIYLLVLTHTINEDEFSESNDLEECKNIISS